MLTRVTFLGSSVSFDNAFIESQFGDLEAKYRAGGAGVYTRPNFDSKVWTRAALTQQPNTPSTGNVQTTTQDNPFRTPDGFWGGPTQMYFNDANGYVFNFNDPNTGRSITGTYARNGNTATLTVTANDFRWKTATAVLSGDLNTLTLTPQGGSQEVYTRGEK
jgi:hypothetical protein